MAAVRRFFIQISSRRNAEMHKSNRQAGSGKCVDVRGKQSSTLFKSDRWCIKRYALGGNSDFRFQFLQNARQVFVRGDNEDEKHKQKNSFTFSRVEKFQLEPNISAMKVLGFPPWTGYKFLPKTEDEIIVTVCGFLNRMTPLNVYKRQAQTHSIWMHKEEKEICILSDVNEFLLYTTRG